MRRVLTLLIATLLIAGCRSQAPAPPPGTTPDSPAPAPTPAPVAPADPPPAAPLTAEVHLLSGDGLVSLNNPIPVGTPSARVMFSFSAPMDQGAVERAISQQVKPLQARFEWPEALRLLVTLEFRSPETVKLDPEGLPDRWGRKALAAAGAGALTLEGPPCMTPRWFAYVPSTGEGHPFNGTSICGRFTEGVADPEGGTGLLLWAQQPTNHGPEYVAVTRNGPLPFSYLGIQPRFYGWLRHTDGFVLGGNGTVKAVDMTGKVLRELTLQSSGEALHGGAVSRRSGLTALFVSGKDGQIHLKTWNPADGQLTDYGSVGQRQGAPGGDAFAYQWIDADWSGDDGQVAFTLSGTLFRFDLKGKKAGEVAAGKYAQPRFSPVDAGQILVASGADSVILSPAGETLHKLPGVNWFWHLFGEALDRSEPIGPGNAPKYDVPVTNYRLSDKRIMVRGRGLVIGHALLPPSSSRLVTLTLIMK